MPFGGSCLPKDLRAAVQYGRRADLMLPVLNAALTSNRLQTQACSNLILSHGRGRVGVFGMSFKAGTDDLRESPALAIIEVLRTHGANVRAFDPTTTGELSPHQTAVLDGIVLVDDPLDVATGADVITVFTEWPDFAKIELAQLAARSRPGVTIVDTRNLFEPDMVREAGFGYDGVGRR
jgi:UDPglucose 6-dehydrogenase